LVKDLLRQRPLLTQPFRKCHKSPDNKAVNRSRRSPSSQIRVSWRRLGYRWRSILNRSVVFLKVEVQ
jgi:hypothetical protein